MQVLPSLSMDGTQLLMVSLAKCLHELGYAIEVFLAALAG